MPHSKFQVGGILTLAAIWSAANGLAGCLPGNATLTNTGTAITTTTLGDGRSAWQILGGSNSQLTSGAQSTTGYYSSGAMARFVWNGYHLANNDARLLLIGNLLYLNITAGRFTCVTINGQNVNVSPSGTTAVPGVEYCVTWVCDQLDTNGGANTYGTARLSVNGTEIANTALNASWSLNSTMNTQVTVGETTNRGVYNLIEFGWYLGTTTTRPLTPAQVSTVAGGGYFLDILRPTHPNTSPMTYTSLVVGGRLTDVHTVSLRRSSNPISDTGSIVATGTRTGPGSISLADPATNTNGRRFYRLNVSSTGGVSMTTTNYSAAAPGGWVLGCVPVLTAPSAAAFSAIAGCPKIGMITDSRGVPQSNTNVPYQVLRGGTTDKVVSVVAPGAGWQHYNDTAYSGTLYKRDGTTQVLSNTDLMTAYLAEAALEGVTVTGIMLDVNNWAELGTDTTYRSRVQGTINRLRNANHKVVILRDIGMEFGSQAQANMIAHEEYIATQADGVNVVYSDDQFQEWYAAHLDYVSMDGTHLTGQGALNPTSNPINGLTAAQITANYTFLAIQSAILPGVLLSINNSTGTMEPGQSLVRTLTLRPTNGYTGPVPITFTGLPTGVTASLSPASPVNIPNSSAVTVNVTFTAAADAPLTGSPATITIGASAATSNPTTTLNLSVVDVTAPQIESVVVDTNGTSITVTTDSIVTGNTGISLFENGSFRALTGALTNLDGYHLTGTLAQAVSAGSAVTWQYNPATGNLVDVGGNEVPSSSGDATNNTGGGGSGETSVGNVVAVLGLRCAVQGEPEGYIPVIAGDDKLVGLYFRDGSNDPAPIPASVTGVLQDAAGASVGTVTLSDSKAVLGYLLLRLQVPGSGNLPTRLRLTFDGGVGRTYKWDVPVRATS